MIIGGVEFPEKCPEKCPGKKSFDNMMAFCNRCPIFNTQETDFPNEDGTITKFRMIEPDDYRHDWAVVWKEWFESGMQDYPELYIKIQGEEK